MEVKVLKEAKEVKDKTLPVHSRAGEFSGPLLPLLPQLRSLPLLRRKFLAKWLAGSLVTLGATLVFSPIAFAQTDTQAEKASETAKSQDAPPALSHDLSGVWMQYRDGDVPGTPGMNGVNEHFRPPLTPWGQAKFDSAQALQGAKAVAGKEDNSVLRCEPSGPPQVLILPNPWEIVQIPGRVLMFFEEQHIWREIWTDGRPLPKDPDPSWLGILGRPLGRRHFRRRNDWFQRQGVGRSLRKSAHANDTSHGALPAVESRYARTADHHRRPQSVHKAVGESSQASQAGAGLGNCRVVLRPGRKQGLRPGRAQAGRRCARFQIAEMTLADGFSRPARAEFPRIRQLMTWDPTKGNERKNEDFTE